MPVRRAIAFHTARPLATPEFALQPGRPRGRDKPAESLQNERMKLRNTSLTLALGAATAAWSLTAAAQAQLTPQQRYERQLAFCNSGKLPDPERNACVRDAGSLLDRSLGGTPRNEVTTSEDGRATIISPAGLPPPNSGSDDVTSRDGRATIVLPADQSPSK